MLKAFLVLVGASLFLFGLFSFGAGAPGIGLCVTGGLIAGSVFFERRPYKPAEKQTPPPGWVDTGERSVDEKTGEITAVYAESGTGERIYIRL